MRCRLLPVLLMLHPYLPTSALAAEPAAAGGPDTHDRVAYVQARKRVDVQHMMAQSNCRRFTGEARDYCNEQAKAEYSAAIVEVQKRYGGSNDARDEAAQAAYEADIMTCRKMGGDARKHCVLDVEMRYR